MPDLCTTTSTSDTTSVWLCRVPVAGYELGARQPRSLPAAERRSKRVNKGATSELAMQPDACPGLID